MRPLIYILCCFCAISTYAQDNDDTSATLRLSEIALLDLEPSNATVTLNVVAPNNAGEKAIIVATNNNKWINFSSAVIEGNSRSISIIIEDGLVPPGIYLKLRTDKYSGIGDGELGSATSVVTLNNNSSQIIVSDIKGAFTGNGINNGYKITYELEIYNYELLDFDQSATLSIRLTLTDF
jgi:hypothetical protein